MRLTGSSEQTSSQEGVLLVDRVSAGYGSFAVLDQVSVSLMEREAITVLGPNGAGKTTLLRVISGVLKAKQGEIVVRGRRIGHAASHAVAHGGLAHVPEGRGIFPGLTVAENLELGSFAARGRSAGDAAAARDGVIALFSWLPDRLTQLAGTLSGGEQQMLAIARALMGQPSILLLDEPSLGLSPKMVDHVFEALGDIRSRGVAVVLVEQSLSHALAFADRGYVMNRGRIVLEGTAAMLAESDVFDAFVAAVD